MAHMDIFKINGQEYYLANDLRSKCPRLFVGCQKSMPELIKKHGLGKDNYTWARLVNGNYEARASKTSNKIDKMMISIKWVHESGLLRDNNETNNCQPTNKYESLPSLLLLEENERIYDNEGKYYNVEVRGERDPEGIYFRAKDVAKMLNKDPKYLKDALTNKDRNYVREEDYKVFIVHELSLMAQEDNKKSGRKLLYLTYYGLLKVMIISRNTNLKKFLGWVTRVVFTAHLGTKAQKKQLAVNLLDTDIKCLNYVFNKAATSLPCVYLIYIGSVKEMRKGLKLNSHYEDGQKIYKYGKTRHIKERFQQHHNNYSKLGSKNMALMKYAMVDPQFITKAEAELKAYFVDNEYVITAHKKIELVILDKNQLEGVYGTYTNIMKKYVGAYKELTDSIDLMKANHKSELLARDNETSTLRAENALLKQKIDYEARLHKSELLARDNEISTLRAENALLKQKID